MKCKHVFYMISIICIVLFITPVTLLQAETASGDKIPDYSLTERKNIPVEYTWRVEDIFPDIEAWKKEIAHVEDMAGQLETLSVNWTGSAKRMLALLEHVDSIRQAMTKLNSYASLQNDSDLGDSAFQQMKGDAETLQVQLQAKTAFMEADILGLGEEAFDRYVTQEPGLKAYSFKIKDVLRNKDHILPAAEEQIYSFSGLFSTTPKVVSGILNNVELPQPDVILSTGKKITLNYANYVLYRADKNPDDRGLVMTTYWANHKKFENTFAALLNGALNEHFFNARVHRYSNCLETYLSENNIDTEVYHKLIRLTRENLEPLHRYLKIKQELLGQDKFNYVDLYASAIKSIEKKYSYAEAQKIIMDMMKVLGKEYTDGLQKAFANRWIDRYPNKNKQSGAYSSGIYGVHPFIKMNYNGEYDTLSTLAHELGHAMHSYFASQTQPYTTYRYPTFLAEIASTFNENILLDYLLSHEKDDLFKLYLLDAFFQQVKGTIYRQVHFAEFELAMHRRVEEGKTLTPDWLNQTYLELARYYYGHDKGVTVVDDYIQNEWASVPHFYRPFYVYTYSTGMIASTALSEMVLKGKQPERERFLNMLKAGGSNYPLDILKLAGVDITTDEPYLLAFKRFNQLAAEMEKIAQRLKKNNSPAK